MFATGVAFMSFMVCNLFATVNVHGNNIQTFEYYLSISRTV